MVVKRRGHQSEAEFYARLHVLLRHLQAGGGVEVGPGTDFRDALAVPSSYMGIPNITC